MNSRQVAIVCVTVLMVLSAESSLVYAGGKLIQADPVLFKMQLQPATEPIDIELTKAFRDQYMVSKFGENTHKVYKKLIDRLQQSIDKNKKSWAINRLYEIIYVVEAHAGALYGWEYYAGGANAKPETALKSSIDLVLQLKQQGLATVDDGSFYDEESSAKDFSAKIKIKASDFEGALNFVKKLDDKVDKELEPFAGNIAALQAKRAAVVSARTQELKNQTSFCSTDVATSGEGTKERFVLTWNVHDATQVPDEGQLHGVDLSTWSTKAQAKAQALKSIVCGFKYFPVLGRCELKKLSYVLNFGWFFKVRDAYYNSSSSSEYRTPEEALIAMGNYQPCLDEASYRNYLNDVVKRQTPP